MRLPEFKRIADILAREHKTRMVEGTAWAASIKKREVYYVKDDIYSLTEDHALGLLLHEIAHIHYTTDSPPQKDHKELYHSITNALEDIAIEHIISQDYPNAGEILKSTETELLDTLIKILPKMEDTSKFEKAILFALIKAKGRGYLFSTRDYEKVGEEISKVIMREHSNIINRKKTADLDPYVTEILNILLKKFGEPTEEERNQMQRGTGDNGEESNESSTSQKTKRQVINSLRGGSGWEKNGINAYDKVQVDYVDETVDQAKTIGKKIRSILKRNQAMEFNGRFRTGKLLPKRIVKIKTSKDRKPFARRIVKSNKSYAFAVASDVSGSMFSSRRNQITPASHALSAMQMVGEALRIAGVPRSLIIFGKTAETINPINKNAIRWNELTDGDKHRTADNGGTRVDLGVKKCIEELNKTRAERKILIVLTDGQTDPNSLMEQLKTARKKEIECIGIYVSNNEYNNPTMDEAFGKNQINILGGKNEKIGQAFVDILKETIKESS